MACKWPQYTVRELIEQGVIEIGDGYRAKNSELGGKGSIFLRAAHVRDTHIDFSGVERFHNVKQEFGPKLSLPGDVIITTKGNSTGRTSFVTHGMPVFVYSPHLSYWRSLSREVLAPDFLRFWVSSEQFTNQLASLSASTDMAPYLSLVDQKRFKVDLPPIEVQVAIAETLASLDEKIALIRGENQTIERFAGSIFKSWFVDFDPVRAKAEGREPEGMDAATAAIFPCEFQDSLLGAIPKKWDISVFDDAVTVTSGGTPKTSRADYWSGEIPWFSIADAPSPSEVFVIDTEKTITDAGLASCSARLLPRGATIISARGTVGKLAVTGVPMAINQSCYALLPKLLGSFGTFFQTGRLVDVLLQRAHGAVFSTITRQTLSSVSIVVPSRDIALRFEEEVHPMMDTILNNRKLEKTLTELRDTLLPRLISGKLQVPEAEKMMEAVL
jgi:type I restriction enzyme, S subunit